MAFNPPSTLDYSNYSNIEALMLADMPSATSALHQFNANDLILGRPSSHNVNDADTSFGRQFSEMLAAESPDLIAFTLKSSVPIADAVRGYYEELGLKSPRLIGISTSRSSYDEFRRLPVAIRANRRRTLTIDNVLKESSAAAVIDQYVCEGNSINYTALTLACGGARTIFGIRGRWWHQTPYESIDSKKLTSTHAPFMKDIGRKACRQFSDQCAPAKN